MGIPFVNLHAQYTEIKEEVEQAVYEVLESQNFILGPKLQAFEEEAAAYLGAQYAIGVANGSDALLLALMALGVGPGDEVITVPHTYIATGEAIHRTGAQVVFCEVDQKTWTMDPEALKAAITPRTKAILPVHIFGQTADMSEILKVAGEIPVVEDAAQAWGASHQGAKAGSIGALGCFSFYPTKTLGGYGDGGLVVTSDSELAQHVQALRVHGESKRYYNNLHGMNSRLDVLQAVILQIKMRYVDGWNQGRQELVQYYQAEFSNLPQLTLPFVAENNESVWHQYVILCEQRDELQEHLRSKGIATGVYYPVPQHLQACFASLGHQEGDFPVSERLSKQGLALPCWPELSEQQRQEIVAALQGFFQ